MLRGPRQRIRQDRHRVIDSGTDTLHGRVYLRRARPAESESALLHAPKTGTCWPGLHTRHSNTDRTSRFNTMHPPRTAVTLAAILHRLGRHAPSEAATAAPGRPRVPRRRRSGARSRWDCPRPNAGCLRVFNRQIDYMILTILLWMDECPASAARLLHIIVHACHDNRAMGKMSLLRTAPLSTVRQTHRFDPTRDS